MSAPISISSHFAPKRPAARITMRFDEDLGAAAKAALRDMIELIRERGIAPHEIARQRRGQSGIK